MASILNKSHDINWQRADALLSTEVGETMAQVYITPDQPAVENIYALKRGYSYAEDQQWDTVHAKYASEVHSWLGNNHESVEVIVTNAADPRVEDRLVPDISENILSRFIPKARKPRVLDAVRYTTKNLIEALKPSDEANQGESFIRHILPDGVSVGEAVVLFDKDERYRSTVAAACYRMMNQMAAAGDLNSVERVKLDSDIKTVSHNDPAVTKGGNRDVVVGMVLDMLSGRFNAKENMETSRAMRDNDRDSNGVFRGGHHSGAAYEVFHNLISANNYDEYFGEPYYTNDEKFMLSFQRPEVLEQLTDPTLKLSSREELTLEKGIKMLTKSGDVKHLKPEVTDLMVAVDEYQLRPISLKQVTHTDLSGKEVKGVRVRHIREAASIEAEVDMHAKDYNVRLDRKHREKIIDELVTGNGFEYFIPEGIPITIGRAKESTVKITHDQSVSRQHCTVRLVAGRFVIEDTSANGSTFTYSGEGVSAYVAAGNATDNGITWAQRSHKDHEWDTFVSDVEADRANQALPLRRKLGHGLLNISKKTTRRTPKNTS